MGGTPYLYVDGVNRGYSSGAWAGHINTAHEGEASLGIVVSGSFDEVSGQGSCTVAIDPEDGASGSYTLQLVLVEDECYYMGSNGYPNHDAVMRDMIPNANGTSITLEPGVPYTESYSFVASATLEPENCRLVAFVQDASYNVLNATTVDLLNMGPPVLPQLSIIDNTLEVVEGDDDGKLNPGETAEIAIRLGNACNFVDAETVSGTLLSSNPYITITESEAGYGSIIACDNVGNYDDRFAFSVSEDAPGFSDFDFELRVVANLDTENPYEIVLPFTMSIDMHRNNFPFTVAGKISGGNATADLDGDGNKEIIFGGQDNLLHAVTLDGTELDGFPFAVGNWIMGSPAVADLDNDGDLEIVVVSRDKKIYVIQHDGSGEDVYEALSFLQGTPALDDLDGDHDLEIVVAGNGYDLIAIHHDGTSLPGYPVSTVNEKMDKGVSIADLDGDGSKDIIVGTYGYKLRAYDLSGNSLTGFPLDLETRIAAPTTVADLDNDGNFEILLGKDGGELNAISGTGEIIWTYSVTTANIRTAVAVTDFDHDGMMELVYTSLDGFVVALDYEGNLLPGWPQSVNGTCYSSPVIADLDGDETPEIIVGSNAAELHAFHIDGSDVASFPIALSGPAEGTPTVDDLNGNGDFEIIIGTNFDLTIIDLKAVASPMFTWSTARGNNQRTGLHAIPWLATDERLLVPETLLLKQNYPNPFNPSTTIEFGIPANSPVSLTIYDVVGQEVKELVNDNLSAGQHSVQWNGLDGNARQVETGIYFARISAAGREQIVKMMLIK